jgi:type 1 fimbriae regulatory protein FimB/type 1 fimbriae regulatory protein FimE
MVWCAAAARRSRRRTHTMLRHTCGYALANKGHDTRAIQAWLGHRSITSTAVYTALAPNDPLRDGIGCRRLHGPAGFDRGLPGARTKGAGYEPGFGVQVLGTAPALFAPVRLKDSHSPE